MSIDLDKCLPYEKFIVGAYLRMKRLKSR